MNDFTEEGTEKIGKIQIFSEGILKPFPYKIIRYLAEMLEPYIKKEVEIKYAVGARGGFGWYEFGKVNQIFINPYPEDINQLPDIFLHELGGLLVEQVLDLFKKGNYEIFQDNQEEIYADLTAFYILRPNIFLRNIKNKLVRDSYMVLKKVFINHDFEEERIKLKILMDEYLLTKGVNKKWDGLSDDFESYTKGSFEKILKQDF